MSPMWVPLSSSKMNKDTGGRKNPRKRARLACTTQTVNISTTTTVLIAKEAKSSISVTDSETAAAAAKMKQNVISGSQSEVEVARCECCGLMEECTPGYIGRVRERFQGLWICGLCGEAVKDETLQVLESSHTSHGGLDFGHEAPASTIFGFSEKKPIASGLCRSIENMFF
ncbi:hypothetical protein JRO89_XS03G0300200 [Xanthoceras sorbifolium]|uniref:Uncharacterized protein n=1 Tax=Xanthoceras sorbifolium TaxID=99658 RepID=A0ABQ8IDG8_9ROSI|nr:hypothetical protein JRO89_XS03G0300200 [Xanthoceras sorbifolium]